MLKEYDEYIKNKSERGNGVDRKFLKLRIIITMKPIRKLEQISEEAHR